ncbi:MULTISPECIES: hypothetical protein [unclassified Leptolyngbya]|uniref:hypothetical protein n=1 Tax=unclassified Leptolyngbya TaxID=2650499 RepID=UPI001685165B|nr:MULTISPECIES: hypothetical protein [unclassified Leptolyngbya]MBD1909196.1 hypothetical protein [Leptolyngbya sp. FACHB-8]MBD2152951.1 hypothetical protein [Leptolyngbya sp. FACHB-16]
MLVRRFAVASTLIAVGAVFATPAMADTINLSGSVASISTVTSTATSNASNLNLYGAGTAGTDTVVQVADLALTTNNKQGITVTATANGPLTSGVNGDSMPYQVLIVGDAAAQPTATSFTSTTASASVPVGVGGFVNGAADRDLYIEYDAPQLLDPGSYTSSITVTIADN